jgi:hypothetical protein
LETPFFSYSRNLTQTYNPDTWNLKMETIYISEILVSPRRLDRFAIQKVTILTITPEKLKNFIC